MIDLYTNEIQCVTQDFVYQCSIDPLFQITQLRRHSTFLRKQSAEQWHSQRIRSTSLLYRNCFPFCFDFPIMHQRLDSRNGLLKEGKRIYLTWIKIGSSSRVKLWITFKLQSRIVFHLEQLQLIVMPFISMMIRSQKGRVPNCQERLLTRAENSIFEIYSWHPSADCFDEKTAAFNLCDKTILTPKAFSSSLVKPI